ncbi:MAG: VOC family protein [Candidatus Brockarchaeota archaeon]|nr:VOC family protein [Candidatus Brockarchaeota archaeon]MBO3841522.1 VOC family protein [Candidatus Brockarchaeota archaeon]
MSRTVQGFRRVTQIGIVVRNIEKSVETWGKLLGVKASGIVETGPLEETGMKYKGRAAEGRAKLAFLQLENITIELIEPVGGPSTWRDFLEKHGEGVHHIAFNVENMEHAENSLREIGVEIEQEGFFTGGAYAYTDPESPLGIIIELLTHNSQLR